MEAADPRVLLPEDRVGDEELLYHHQKDIPHAYVPPPTEEPYTRAVQAGPIASLALLRMSAGRITSRPLPVQPPSPPTAAAPSPVAQPSSCCWWSRTRRSDE
jgi:hypothetical protein